jgi:hypothetical protein
MLRPDDPIDNRDLGWMRLTEPQVIDLLYIGLKLSMPSDRRGLTDRNATKADAAAKAIATSLAARLHHYPIFGPARPFSAAPCGAGQGPVPDRGFGIRDGGG